MCQRLRDNNGLFGRFQSAAHVARQVTHIRHLQRCCSLTGGEDLEDDDEVGHVVSRHHGALLVRAHLTHFFNLL